MTHGQVTATGGSTCRAACRSGALRGLLSAVLVLIAVAVLTTAVTLWCRGCRFYAVRTGSMSPTLAPGDLAIDAPARRYAVGDVITFRHGTVRDSVTTHRVHAKQGQTLQTKGDANRTPDIEPVLPREVVGRMVAAVPRGGYVVVFLRQPAGAASVAAFAASLILAWGLFFPGLPEPAMAPLARAALPKGSSS